MYYCITGNKSKMYVFLFLYNTLLFRIPKIIPFFSRKMKMSQVDISSTPLLYLLFLKCTCLFIFLLLNKYEFSTHSLLFFFFLFSYLFVYSVEIVKPTPPTMYHLYFFWKLCLPRFYLVFWGFVLLP